MFTRTRRILTIAVVVLTLAADLFGGAVAFAAEDGGQPTAPVAAQGGARGSAVADFLGMSPEDLHAALADGKTLAEIAAEQGRDVDALVGFLLERLQERLDAAVAAGRIDADRRDALLGTAEERLRRLVTTPHPGRVVRRRARRARRRVVRREARAIVVDLLGVDAATLAAELRDGATLADVAAGHDVSVDELVAALLQPMADHLEQAVAAGRMTEGERAEALAKAEARLRTAVTTPHPRRARRRRRAAPRHAADVLGMTPEELRGRLQGGATLEELVREAGMDDDAFADALRAPVAERLDAAVAAGRLTAEEAATRLAGLRAGVLARLGG